MNQEVNTLIALLEDNDAEVLKAVRGELFKKGAHVIPELEKAWEKAPNNVLQERLEGIIHHIQFTGAKSKLTEWISSGAKNLLEGATYVAQFQYPGVEYSSIERNIENISRDIYLTESRTLSAIEKVRLLNYVVYDLNRFVRNTANFYSPQNSFINQVIDTRKGNPISLGIIYLAIAQRLELPIYGVNLPKSFILAYMNEFRHYDAPNMADDVLFYINPYNKGTILNRREVTHFISQQKLEPKDVYYTPCDNKSIIIRMITNLVIAYQKIDMPDKVKLLEDILLAISKTELKNK